MLSSFSRRKGIEVAFTTGAEFMDVGKEVSGLHEMSCQRAIVYS